VIRKLRNTLIAVREQSGPDFSGVGLILYSNLAMLPIFPLRRTVPQIDEYDVIGSLAKIASVSSEYHDGFHLISSKWKITHVAQYFSPPIIETAEVDRTKLFGGRYLAALFGSSLPGVMLCGVASNGFGIAIFKSGKEVLFEELP
jgi:hypothetical protein